MFGSLAHEPAAASGQMPEELPAFHTRIAASLKLSLAAFNASARLNSKASLSADRRFTINSDRVFPWLFTPGISVTQPIHQTPSFFTTAVNFLFMTSGYFLD